MENNLLHSNQINTKVLSAEELFGLVKPVVQEQSIGDIAAEIVGVPLVENILSSTEPAPEPVVETIAVQHGLSPNELMNLFAETDGEMHNPLDFADKIYPAIEPYQTTKMQEQVAREQEQLSTQFEANSAEEPTSNEFDEDPDSRDYEESVEEYSEGLTDQIIASSTAEFESDEQTYTKKKSLSSKLAKFHELLEEFVGETARGPKLLSESSSLTKNIFEISSKRDNEPCEGELLLRTAKLMSSTNDGTTKYRIACECTDGTGKNVRATLFHPTDQVRKNCEAVKNMVIKFTGKINIFRGEKQIILDSMTTMGTTSTVEDYIKSDPALQLYIQMSIKMFDLISPGPLRSFMEFAIASDDNFERMATHKAGISKHGVKKGDLLIHSFRVAYFACANSIFYGNTDFDMCIVGGFLHDIGKLQEFDDTSYNYAGSLIGHETLGVSYLSQLIRDYNMMCEAQLNPNKITDNLAASILHIVASHPWEPEYNATRKPQTIEAMTVSRADMTEATLDRADSVVSGAIFGEVSPEVQNTRITQTKFI